MKFLRATGAVFLLSTLSPAAAQVPHSYLMNVVNLDISAQDFNKFMAAARDNAEASLKDEGCHEFNIGISKNDPHHVLFVEVYDNADTLDHHRQTDHYKRYQAATKDMVVKRERAQFMSVPMDFSANAK
jgi:(4S)-4-hydroxy-5-phosphonooxypentane-2,3-dione isomerase